MDKLESILENETHNVFLGGDFVIQNGSPNSGQETKC